MTASVSQQDATAGGMTTRRRIALGAGAVAFVGAVLSLVGYTALDLGDGTMIVVSLFALGVAVTALHRRRHARESAETPDPERRTRVPVPGSTLSTTLNQFLSTGGSWTRSNTRIVEGLREAAIAVLTRFEGCSEDEARERIERGDWTDDTRAAAFLSPDLETVSPSVRERLVRALNRRTAFRLGVRRATAAVAAIGYAGLGDRSAPETIPAYDESVDDVDPRTAASDVDGVVSQRSRRTGRWIGIGAVAFVAIGVGALAESPGVLLAGAVGVGYAGFARTMTAPVPEIELSRTTSDDAPAPGDEVTVEVTIENRSDRFLPDLRFVDGVPSGLAVVDGTARLAAALRPGETVTLEYTVTARRGRHEFDPGLAITRDLSRSSERESLVGAAADADPALVCEPSLQPVAAPVPLRAAAATFTGRLRTDEGGSGTEFHSVREYRKSDPLNRIDWNRHARTGELATLDFHEERAARVLVLVDAREAAYLAPEPDAPHAVDRSVAAAGRVAASLLEDGDTVGLAAIGPVDRPGESGVDSADGDRVGRGDACWLAPSSGHHHRVRLQHLLATHPQFSTLPPEDRSRWIAQLRTVRRRLSAATQVMLFTPLCDQFSVDIARRLESRGHPVTVISPDPTAERTAGQQLARVGRRIRRFDLQRAGIPVVDWAHDGTIDEAFARTDAGGRR